MTDRVPGAPGQYRAVISSENLLKMQGGEAFTITLTRDDQPITEGTPYSKAAVLPDELAEKLCPNVTDPTPADALAALHAKAIESAEYPGCYYRTVDGEQEWLNPPMVVGVAYRTTERHEGKPVYVKTVSLGTLPNSENLNFKQVRHGEADRVLTPIIFPIRCNGYYISDDGGAVSVPDISWVSGYAISGVSFSATYLNIEVRTSKVNNFDWSQYVGYATMWFTRESR